MAVGIAVTPPAAGGSGSRPAPADRERGGATVPTGAGRGRRAPSSTTSDGGRELERRPASGPIGPRDVAHGAAGNAQDGARGVETSTVSARSGRAEPTRISPAELSSRSASLPSSGRTPALRNFNHSSPWITSSRPPGLRWLCVVSWGSTRRGNGETCPTSHPAPAGTRAAPATTATAAARHRRRSAKPSAR